MSVFDYPSTDFFASVSLIETTSVSTSQQIESKLKSIKLHLVDEFGIDQIDYFGSFARGDYIQDSDLDILVSFKRRVGWKFFDLKEYLESVVGRKVALVTERSLRKQWKDAILEQVIYV